MFHFQKRRQPHFTVHRSKRVINLAQECIILITEGYYFIQLFDGNKMLSSETNPVSESVSFINTRNWKVNYILICVFYHLNTTYVYQRIDKYQLHQGYMFRP